MRIASVRLPGMLALGLLLGGGSARAEFMNWSYHWSVGPAPVLSSGNGLVALALYRGGRGAESLRVAAETTSSSATNRDANGFYRNFNLTLHLTDNLSHRSGALTFHGVIAGNLTFNSAHLVEAFRDPRQRLVLGGHTYFVSLPSRLNLVAPGSAFVPTLVARVDVENNWWRRPRFATTANSLGIADSFARVASVPQSNSPEPSALSLAGLGVVFGVLGAWRCRRLVALA